MRRNLPSAWSPPLAPPETDLGVAGGAQNASRSQTHSLVEEDFSVLRIPLSEECAGAQPRRRRGSRRQRRQPIGVPIAKPKPAKAKAKARPSFIYRTRTAVYHAVHDGTRWQVQRFEA
jgi:hypothetical protein